MATWAATVAAPIGQGDFAGYGGLNRPVMVYQMDSYRYWERGRNNFSYGQFGENFTVDGLPDDEVCIGDRYDPVESRHRAQGTRLYAVFRFGDDPVTCEPVSGRNSLLFNGRTADSDSVNLGSNPGSPAGESASNRCVFVVSSLAGIALKLPRVSAPANASVPTRDAKRQGVGRERPKGTLKAVFESSDMERFAWVLMEV